MRTLCARTAAEDGIIKAKEAKTTEHRELYFIGGVPCCGKTTAAQALCAGSDFIAFSFDRNMERYTHLGMLDGDELLRAAAIGGSGEDLLAEPEKNCARSLELYRHMFPYALREARELGDKVIAEGAGFLPDELHRIGIDNGHCVFLVPSDAFQRDRYRQREWVQQLLKNVEEPERVFDLWMQKNALLADEIRRQCARHHYRCLTTDDFATRSNTLTEIKLIFGWRK